MTSSITDQQPHEQTAPAIREWCCGTPVTAPHADGCAYDPRNQAGAVPVVESAPEPPPAPNPAPAAASPRSYGIVKADEFDLPLPSGSLVRCRKLTKSHLIQLNLVEIMDAFTPELLAEARSGDEDVAKSASLKALTDPVRNVKIFGPLDRIVAAAVIIPELVMEGPSTGEKVNVADVEIEDKLTIFSAAIGEQLSALKSIRQ